MVNNGLFMVNDDGLWLVYGNKMAKHRPKSDAWLVHGLTIMVGPHSRPRCWLCDG